MLTCWPFDFYEHDIFRAKCGLSAKNFFTSRPGLLKFASLLFLQDVGPYVLTDDTILALCYIFMTPRL